MTDLFSLAERGSMVDARWSSPETTNRFMLLRALIAALGERAEPSWWRTQFLTNAGLRAAARVFPRTAVSAALRSASIAARSEHDRLVGIGGRYHLFRLPVEVEHAIDENLRGASRQTQLADLLSQEADLLIGEVSRLACDQHVVASEGPIAITDSHSLRAGLAIEKCAAHYHAAFVMKQRCFPYFERRERYR